MFHKWFHSYGERGWMAVCSFLAMLIFGVLLLFHPENIYNLLLNLAGGLLIAVGLIRALSYFPADPMKALEDRRLSAGLVMALAGILIIVFKNLFISVLPLVLGAVMLVGGAIRLQGGLDIRRLGGEKSGAILISAALSIVMGLVIVLNPFTSGMALLRVIGAFLIVETLMDGVYFHKFNQWMDELRRRF